MTTPEDRHLAEVADLLPLVLDGLADTDQFNRLNALLRDHAEARLYYLQYMDLHAELCGPTDIFEAAQTQETLPDVFGEVIDDALKARQLHELVLHAQAQLEENLKREQEQQQAIVATKARGKIEIVIPTWAVIGSVAAAAALIVLAVLPFLQSDPPPKERVAHQDTPAQSVPAPPQTEPIVATLTAMRDAQWAEAELALDDHLIAGQRLSLIAGFAEITTSRGAVAILEAPVTIELIDSPNALRLIAGKLIGICETEPSKGFLVRTPHMDVTDLGTRFGINASEQDSVEVHVFLGEVEVSPAALNVGNEYQPEQLLAGQAARISADTQSLERITADISLFETTTARILPLTGTGQDVEPGQPDTNWKIVAVDGQPLEQAHILTTDSSKDYVAWPSTDLSSSQWLSWKHDVERPANGRKTYLFQTHFDIPAAFDIENTQIAIRYLADNQLVAVYVNGHRIAVDVNSADADERKVRSVVIEEHLVAGQNTLAFEVINIWPKQSGSNPVGLRLEAELTQQASPVDGDWRRIFSTPQ